MGIESEEIIKTFNVSEEDAKCYDTIMKHFDNYFKPKKNIIRLRRIFSRRLQEEQEDIELFLRALYKIADDCSFTDKKERIHDQFVAGIRYEELAEKLELMYLHNSNNYTLETVLEYSITYTDVKKGRSMKENHRNEEIDFVRKQKNTKYDSNCNHCGSSHPKNKCLAYVSNCNHCGSSHPKNKCLAYVSNCNHCGSSHPKNKCLAYVSNCNHCGSSHPKNKCPAYVSNCNHCGSSHPKNKCLAYVSNCNHCGSSHPKNKCLAYDSNCNHCGSSHPKNKCPAYVSNCNHCGSSHTKNKCTAFGKQCSFCKKDNHYAAMCWKKRQHRVIHNVEESDEEDMEDKLDAYLGECNHTDANTWTVKLRLNGTNATNFKVDTGADVTIINS